MDTISFLNIDKQCECDCYYLLRYLYLNNIVTRNWSYSKILEVLYKVGELTFTDFNGKSLDLYHTSFKVRDKIIVSIISYPESGTWELDPTIIIK